MSNFDRIPQELKGLRQWVNWRGKKVNGKLTKEPFIPGTDSHASSTDPSTWRSFVEAVGNIGHTDPYVISGIGFVFTHDDPYCGIDLDSIKEKDTAKRKVIAEKQKKLFEDCQSYTELSPSKEGAHIIVKASIPTGIHPDGFGIFSHGRFFTFTGDAIAARPLEIVDCQAIIDAFVPQIKPELIEAPAIAQKLVIDRLMGIPKAVELACGNWQQYGYPSQSEADQALMNFVAIFTQNIVQMKDIFRDTRLYRKDKGDNYLTLTAKSALKKSPIIIPSIDTSSLALPQTPLMVTDKTYLPPPGLLGDIAEYIYQSSPYPSREISLAGAIALMAGICGRQYNVGGTGLNMYVVVVALTGTGKESAVRGMNRLMNEVIKRVPAAAGFMGNGYFASGQALHKKLLDIPHSFVSSLGEFGSLLDVMCGPSASNSEKTLKKVMLDLFPKSGKSDVLRGMSYSDKEKNIPDVFSPAFSFLGDTAPELFYKNFTPSTIMQGLIPRFLTIEHTSWDGGAMREFSHLMEPSENLVARLAELCDYVLSKFKEGKIVSVEPTEESVKAMINFEIQARSHMQPGQSTVTREMWSRANMKMRRLAAIATVGEKYFDPIMPAHTIAWAKELVEVDIGNIMTHIKVGDTQITDKETGQIYEIKKAIRVYLTSSFEELKSSNMGTKLMKDNYIIPVSYISRVVLCKPVFTSNAYKKPSKLMHETLDAMVADGDVIYVSSNEPSFSGKCIRVNNQRIFEGL